MENPEVPKTNQSAKSSLKLLGETGFASLDVFMVEASDNLGPCVPSHGIANRDYRIVVDLCQTILASITYISA